MSETPDRNPKISVQIEPETRQKLTDVAMVIGKTEKAVVEAALATYLTALEEKVGAPLKDALAAIKAARSAL